MDDPSFNTIDELIEHIENHALDYKYSSQIGELFHKLRDDKYKNGEKEEAEKAQWEIDFFNFVLSEGELKSHFSMTNQAGEVEEYPDLKRFNEATYEYLIMRQAATNNPSIKARYSQILWRSPKRDYKFAKDAVDAYLKLIPIYEEKDKTDPGAHWGLELINAVQNALSISAKVGYKTDEVKENIKRLTVHYDINGGSSFRIRYDLIGIMLQNKKIFGASDFENMQEVCDEVSRMLTEKGNRHAAIDLLELGEKVDSKLGTKKFAWRDQIAKLYEELMLEADASGNLAVTSFCLDAIENYKLSGNKEKVEELEKKYNEVKCSGKYSSFSQEVDLAQMIEKFRSVAEMTAKERSSEEILQILVHDKEILPDLNKVREFCEELKKESPFLSLIPKATLDHRGHTVQHFADEEEKAYYEILQQYGRSYELQYALLIRELFFAAIKENKLNSMEVVNFIKKNAWFGKTLRKQIANGEYIDYSWIPLIMPALHLYLRSIQLYLDNPGYRPDFVLCLDSLVLKLEGLIRDFCHFQGVSTFFMKKDQKGRTITMEKDIHALLFEPKMKESFDEDDLLLFRFLLVEKAGYNLRHKIAHALMTYSEYRLDYIHLVIVAMFRLAKYDFGEKTEESSEQTDYARNSGADQVKDAGIDKDLSNSESIGLDSSGFDDTGKDDDSDRGGLSSHLT